MNKFIEDVKMMTDGQLSIEYIPFGEKGNMDYRKIFSAVADGTVEMGFGISKFWEEDKITGNDFWYAIPFGLNARDMYDWLKQGGGLELRRKIYAGYNVVPFPIGDTGGAMGGWFRNKIENIDNLKGMRIRDSGLPAKVWEKIGAVPNRYLWGEIILEAYNRRQIDVIVVLGPYVDQDYSFHKGPQYYYYPGWQQPCGVLSLIINKKKWDQLPGNFKKIIEIVRQHIPFYT